ncbi:hypothetical protein PLEOSDRAFT_1090327 [Pleurotus ostreatus PC15]|uniref:Uncharacterized protein n=1 Tax=Pleurotus ostreatus (strain PC15) TaxID=1137138 RepID=A0A067N8X0_PLEO1|nr:hypothetical protein PLEOSDRAFT_1090327 [Pleurotus ostreatus PC15]
MPSILLSRFRYESRGRSMVSSYPFAVPSVIGCRYSSLRVVDRCVLDCRIISSAYPAKQVAFVDSIHTEIDIKTRSKVLMP